MKVVDRGAALLDERLPGWREVVDPYELSLADCSRCVLGQLFGTYARGLAALELDHPEKYGFYKPAQTTWERLTADWQRVVAR